MTPVASSPAVPPLAARTMPPAAVKLPSADAQANPARLMKTARDFEAMAIGQLLQPMFDTVDTAKGQFGGGSAEATWRPMMVTEMAKQIEAHGGFGLAAPIYAAMLHMQEEKKP